MSNQHDLSPTPVGVLRFDSAAGRRLADYRRDTMSYDNDNVRTVPTANNGLGGPYDTGSGFEGVKCRVKCKYTPCHRPTATGSQYCELHQPSIRDAPEKRGMSDLVDIAQTEPTPSNGDLKRRLDKLGRRIADLEAAVDEVLDALDEGRDSETTGEVLQAVLNGEVSHEAAADELGWSVPRVRRAVTVIENGER